MGCGVAVCVAEPHGAGAGGGPPLLNMCDVEWVAGRNTICACTSLSEFTQSVEREAVFIPCPLLYHPLP